MNTAQPKIGWLRLVLVAALFVAILIALVPFHQALADSPDNGQSIIVSSDGEESPVQQVNATFARPFKGTGVVNERGSGETPSNGNILPGDTESVIGVDGRTQILKTAKYPNSAIASLVFHQSDGFDYICTGWFIAPRALATAGHCVFDPSLGTFATNMRVYPGRNGNTIPFGSAIATRLFTNKCWKNTASPECDYGLIKLGTDLGTTTGYFGFVSYANATSLQNHAAIVRGYPGDKPSGTMWTMKGPIEQVTTTRIGYSIDTFGGQSGSPVYGSFVVNGSTCNPCGVGIHAYGVGATPFTSRNSGDRITQKIFNFFCNKRGLAC